MGYFSIPVFYGIFCRSRSSCPIVTATFIWRHSLGRVDLFLKWCVIFKQFSFINFPQSLLLHRSVCWYSWTPACAGYDNVHTEHVYMRHYIKKHIHSKKKKPLKFEIGDDKDRRWWLTGTSFKHLPERYFCQLKSLKLWTFDQGEKEK